MTADWTRLLAGGSVVPESAGAALAAQAGPAPRLLRKLALVSHDYMIADSAGRHDHCEHFRRIDELGDAEGCDTIVYPTAPGTRARACRERMVTCLAGSVASSV